MKDDAGRIEKAEVRRALESSVISTFEDMPFIDVTADPESGTVNHSQIMYVDFVAPVRGGMALYLPYKCKKSIIENIYSKAFASLTSKEIDDCLLEILNVMAGSFLRDLFGNGSKYRVDLPKIIFDDRALNLKNTGLTELFFCAEGEPFKVSVVLD